MALSPQHFRDTLYANTELKKSLQQCLDIITANRAILAESTGKKDVAKAEKWARYLLEEKK